MACPLPTVPLPRGHLVCYAGGLAPQSKLRDAIIPTPRQQGVEGAEPQTGTPSWHWARLLGRVCALAMAPWPLCRRGARRILAAIPQESVIPRRLRHLTRASVPPPIAPARCRQELCAFAAAHVSVGP
jgi:hypothetical protein